MESLVFGDFLIPTTLTLEILNGEPIPFPVQTIPETRHGLENLGEPVDHLPGSRVPTIQILISYIGGRETLVLTTTARCDLVTTFIPIQS